MASGQELRETDLPVTLALASGERHVLRVVSKFRVRLPIDPADAQAWDDRFTLLDDKGARQKLSVADDKVPGDGFVDLEYEVTPGRIYSLEVDLGAGHQPFFLFEDHSYDQLMKG